MFHDYTTLFPYDKQNLVMFLIVALEFGGTVMMTIYQNIVIYLMGFIIKNQTNPHFKKNF